MRENGLLLATRRAHPPPADRQLKYETDWPVSFSFQVDSQQGRVLCGKNHAGKHVGASPQRGWLASWLEAWPPA